MLKIVSFPDKKKDHGHVRSPDTNEKYIKRNGVFSTVT